MKSTASFANTTSPNRSPWRRASSITPRASSLAASSLRNAERAWSACPIDALASITIQTVNWLSNSASRTK
jgi:hypothetical protein